MRPLWPDQHTVFTGTFNGGFVLPSKVEVYAVRRLVLRLGGQDSLIDPIRCDSDPQPHASGLGSRRYGL